VRVNARAPCRRSGRSESLCRVLVFFSEFDPARVDDPQGETTYLDCLLENGGEQLGRGMDLARHSARSATRPTPMNGCSLMARRAGVTRICRIRDGQPNVPILGSACACPFVVGQNRWNRCDQTLPSGRL
jgi:hypothetical protein